MTDERAEGCGIHLSTLSYGDEEALIQMNDELVQGNAQVDEVG